MRFARSDGADALVCLNRWASMDPACGYLKFYLPDDQREFPWALPVLADLSYWGDPNFYPYFCGRLLERAIGRFWRGSFDSTILKERKQRLQRPVVCFAHDFVSRDDRRLRLPQLFAAHLQ
jgi:hypothetical protein